MMHASLSEIKKRVDNEACNSLPLHLQHACLYKTWSSSLDA